MSGEILMLKYLDGKTDDEKVKKREGVAAFINFFQGEIFNNFWDKDYGKKKRWFCV